TLGHRDTINAAAGGTFMKRRPEECYNLIKNMTAHHNDWDTTIQKGESCSSLTSFNAEIAAHKNEMSKMNNNFLRMFQNQQVNSVTPSYETCGSPHSYHECQATGGHIQNNLNNQNQNYQNRNHGNNQGNNQGRNQFFQGASQVQNPNPNYQALAYQAPIHQPQIVTTSDFSNYIKANDVVMKNMPTQMTSLTNSNIELKNMFGTFMKMNTDSTSSLGPLPSNTIANPKGKLKEITTRRGVSYDGPLIPPPFSSLPKVVEREPEVTKDTVQPSTKNIQPPVVQTQVLIDEPVVKPTMPYPSRMNKQKLHEKDDKLALKFLEIFRKLHFELSFTDALLHMPKFALMFKSLLNNKEKLFDLATTPVNENCSATERALIDVYGEEITLRVDDEAITFKVGQTSKYSYNDVESINGIDVIDVACEEYFQEVIGFSEISKSVNTTPIAKPIVAPSSLALTPFGDSDFLLEETNAFLGIEDDSISPEMDDSYYDSKGDRKSLSPKGVRAREEGATIGFAIGVANDVVMKNMPTQMTSLTNSNIELKNMFGTFMKMNTDSTLSLGPLPSNTIANPKGKLKEITTRMGVSYDGPLILPPFSSLPKVVEREPEVTKDTVQPSTKNIQPPVVQTQVLIDEPVVKPTMPYPSRMNKQKLREKDDKLALKFLEIFRKLHFELSFADALLHMPKFAPIFKSDLILEEIEACLKRNSIPPGIDDTNSDLEGDIHLLEELLNNDPSSSPLPSKELNVEEHKTVKSSIDEPPELELKELPSHLDYAFLEGIDKLPVIISKELKDEEKSALLKILIDPKDQEKATFTCPYGMFAYRRMPFGLCNAPDTFQRYMMAIFHDMIEKMMEVFMDDFSVFGDSFSLCLSHLDKMLKRCKDTNLVLNWEKCHFMVKEGIVLGHKNFEFGTEVDRAKVDVIAKLPHPTSVKDV
nr:reverse transcriptase domain-containing protein [Tanacetum cinerariifolium]